MAEQLVINVDRFWKRLHKLFNHWKKNTTGAWRGARSFLIASLGEEPTYRKSLALELWLFGYELFSTYFVFCKKTTSLYIVAGAKATSILKQVGESKTFGETTLNVIFSQRNKADKYAGNLKTLLTAMDDSEIKAESPKILAGMLTKEAVKGSFAKLLVEKIKEKFDVVDISIALAEVLACKDTSEQKTVQTACEFTSAVLKKFLVCEIETIIDEEKKVKHSDLAAAVEDVLEDPSKIKSDINLDSIDSCYTPIIQSGGKYSLKPSASSNDDQLHSAGGGTIIVSLGARYKSYCSNISRTYFIDPSKEQERVYNCLLSVYQAVLKHLRHNEKLNKPMEAALAVIKKKKPELLAKFTKNCGFGIGLEFRESTLLLNTKNRRLAKAGMVFNICVGFEDLHDRDKEAKGNAKAANYACMIADTVLITKDEPEKLTHCARRLKDVSYTLEGESDEEKDEDEEMQIDSDKEMEVEVDNAARQKSSAGSSSSSSAAASSAAGGAIATRMTRRSTRHAGGNGVEIELQAEAESKRRKTQKDLLRAKQKFNIQKYVTSERGGFESDEESDYEDPVTYKAIKSYPVRRLTKIFVDENHDAVLVPINGSLTPFHISTIKNVNTYEHNNYSYLRINFISPSSVGRHRKSDRAVAHHAEEMWIKELEYRSKGHQAYNNVERQIKNLAKRVKQREDDNNKENVLVRMEPLVLQRDKRYVPRLSQLKIKPNLGGKRKGTGSLEAHVNGFRFHGNVGQKVDIIYNNIKHAFYQPCDNSVSVVLHFHLRHPMQVGRKKTSDIQVYYEVIDSSVDIDRRGGGFYDRDGLREEQEERQMRKKWNRNFRDFARNAEKVIQNNKQCKKLEFDIPHKDLEFTGVPNKTKVRIMPAANCLVSLEDSPAFVLSFKEVEIAHFERVQFQLRAFDLVFVLKDFKKPVVRIDAIPSQHLETIKEYLNDAGILYFEGAVNLDWVRVMKEIRDDTRGFFSQGGWNFLDTEMKDGGDAQGGDSPHGNDSDYVMDDNYVSEGSEDSEEFDSASSEVSEYSSEDEEMDEPLDGDEGGDGLSWDQHARKAMEADRRSAMKFNEDEGPKRKKRRRGRY